MAQVASDDHDYRVQLTGSRMQGGLYAHALASPSTSSATRLGSRRRSAAGSSTMTSSTRRRGRTWRNAQLDAVWPASEIVSGAKRKEHRLEPVPGGAS